MKIYFGTVFGVAPLSTVVVGDFAFNGMCFSDHFWPRLLFLLGELYENDCSVVLSCQIGLLVCHRLLGVFGPIEDR